MEKENKITNKKQLAYTPGPWSCCISKKYFPHVHVGENTCKKPRYYETQYGTKEKCGGRYITINDATEPTDLPEYIANARLIAAAPELLEALKTISITMAQPKDRISVITLESYEKIRVSVQDIIQQAITKAEGD